MSSRPTADPTDRARSEEDEQLVTEAAHDTHFLSRLARVSAPEAELALALYRDVPLLRYIIEVARVPEGAERVALSLADPARGPFIIVTREGRFVTCLGAGMTTELPIITRGRLDALAERVAELRERMARAREVAARAGGVNRLVGRVLEAGWGLSREEFVGVAGLQPLMRRDLFASMFGAGEVVRSVRRLLRGLRRVRRPEEATLLRHGWNAAWAVGHLEVLSTLDGRELIEELPADWDAWKANLSWGAVRQNMIGVALRGAWAVGRMGKLTLGAYKDHYATAASPLQLIDKGMGLMAIGTRHARLRAEVAKALGHPPATVESWTPALTEAIGALMRALIISPMELTVAAARDMGASVYTILSKAVPEDRPHRILDKDAVPEDLALAAVMQMPMGFVENMDMLNTMLTALPWMARAEPEHFYFPAEVHAALVGRPSSEEMLAWIIDPLRRHYGPQAPVRAAPATGRNEPCPCGSGRKYKRCCGAPK